MDSQDIFLGNERGISKDIPNEHHWWDIDWIISGCKSLLVVIAYYDQAVPGDTEAAKMVVGILERVAKINGVIPDKSLVTVDQRAMKLEETVTFKIDGDHTPMGKLAKKVTEDDKDY